MQGKEIRAGLLGMVVLAAAAVLPARPASGPPATGAVEGVVRFTGKLPPPRKVVTADGPIEYPDLVVDKKTKGLADVVACLADVPAQPRVSKREPVLVDQKDLRFVPRVVAVQNGQAVRFDNSDRFNHSVRASSTVAKNTFNLFVSPGNPVDCVFVPQKHPVAIDCSLHPCMRAWVYVFTHPHFTVSNGKGTFRIADLRPGKYTLWLRHAATGLQAKRAVEVRAGRITHLEVGWQKVEP
jgi:plastocyanin